MMHIGIQAARFKITEGLRNYCERRLRFALGPTSGRVHSVLVRLTDENGPRGGVDKRCSIRAVLRKAPLVIIVQDEADMYTAIDHAADRIARAISRRLDRTWSIRRSAISSQSDDYTGDSLRSGTVH
jgi:putative sigma-54 modulation protein